jgi:branched-chain amino acid transport system substrate-binding protein
MRLATRWTGSALGLALLGLAAVTPALAQGPLKVGVLVDLTGPTSEVGKQYAQGVQDAVAWKNEQGGINGRKVEISVVDYGYKPPQAVAAYKKFVEQDQVLMINGWGTGDTEALREFVNKEKIVYISASFSGHLTDPAKTPYNFFVGASYSDQLRGFLKFVKDGWKDKGRNPRVAFIYADNPYGRAPIEAGRAYAKEVGVDLVDEQIVPSSFQDSTSQLLNMQKKDPDFAYINTTTSWVAVILKDAQKLGIKTKFGMNPYGFGELLPQIAKDAAEGTYGVIPEVPFGAEVPGMKKIVEWNQKKHGGAFRDNLYVRGWAYGLVWMEALKRAGKDVTRESIKNALESFRNVDFEGIIPPVTYTKEDHRPTTVVNIYQVQAGKIVKAGQVELPRKKEWLGL